MKKQRCIGIIGGVGPQATEYLYQKLILLAQKRYGVVKNNEFPRILILSEPVTDFISSTEKLDEAREQVISATERLIASGVTCIAIASNTVHLLATDVQKLCNYNEVEFISMIDAVAEECKNESYNSIGLLASPVTLRLGVYDKVFEKTGILLKKPSAQKYEQLGCIIKQVIADNVDQKSIDTFLKILDDLHKSTDAVVLGCTELPVLYKRFRKKYLVIDTSYILAKKLLEFYYSNNK